MVLAHAGESMSHEGAKTGGWGCGSAGAAVRGHQPGGGGGLTGDGCRLIFAIRDRLRVAPRK